MGPFEGVGRACAGTGASYSCRGVDLWLETDGREGVQARLFRDNDFVYIIAVNHEKPTQKNVMFALQSVSSNMQWADQCQVMFEDRQIQVKGGSWKDGFGSYGVHVYKLNVAE